MKKEIAGFRVYIFEEEQWKPTYWGLTDSELRIEINSRPPFLTRDRARKGKKEAKEMYPQCKYAIFHGVDNEPGTP
jgi:hypothetical protein